jgi:hypothetical protein
MVICPIALAVHCTGCPLVKFCPAKKVLGDFVDELVEPLTDTTAKSNVADDEKKPDGPAL